jgi:Ssp1 endopeptidase immunity protein Rap1a
MREARASVYPGRAPRAAFLMALVLAGAPIPPADGSASPSMVPAPPVQGATALSPDVSAKPRSARMLYRLCEAEADRPLRWCEGYLLGLADLLVAMGNSRMEGGICNADYEPATLGRVFEAWVDRHPERSEEDMMVAAQAAFHELWPCR